MLGLLFVKGWPLLLLLFGVKFIQDRQNDRRAAGQHLRQEREAEAEPWSKQKVLLLCAIVIAIAFAVVSGVLAGIIGWVNNL